MSDPAAGWVVVVAGPTASGKSGLAVEIAESFDGTVINADALQVYAELEILTARPGATDLGRAPHRLYGMIPAADRFSVARWRAAALAEIAVAHAGGRLPVVVGGTGLYLKALIEGLAEIPGIPAEIRGEAQAAWRNLGCPGFHAELARRDPASALRLEPGDRQRLIRAWEVFAATGRSIVDWQAQPGQGVRPGLAFQVIVLDPPRDRLYAACNGRFQAMIARGGLDEVRALAACGLEPGLPAMKALGVPELHAHLRGETTLDQAIVQAQQATRRYAKRQVTWFRHQLVEPRRAAGQPCYVHIAQDSECLRQKIISFLCKSH
ncbi:MAG: tRNA (adenosine(37)-N6)-dimethylallyltransferase MiaA [Azospirillum sp.]|nr:tRNA (adenosine(37)-N6)-dimethylallyltransferase MiaA [Azospirillum sp.]